MLIKQLNPPIPMQTPKGHGFAHFLIDYGMETHLYWVVFDNETGEIWTWDNTKVRAEKNITMGREMKKKIHLGEKHKKEYEHMSERGLKKHIHAEKEMLHSKEEKHKSKKMPNKKVSARKK